MYAMLVQSTVKKSSEVHAKQVLADKYHEYENI